MLACWPRCWCPCIWSGVCETARVAVPVAAAPAAAALALGGGGAPACLAACSMMSTILLPRLAGSSWQSLALVTGMLSLSGLRMLLTWSYFRLNRHFHSTAKGLPKGWPLDQMTRPLYWPTGVRMTAYPWKHWLVLTENKRRTSSHVLKALSSFSSLNLSVAQAPICTEMSMLSWLLLLMMKYRISSSWLCLVGWGMLPGPPRPAVAGPPRAAMLPVAGGRPEVSPGCCLCCCCCCCCCL
mmetsp:Transcript_17975/g.45286  ORF Transcript_17975/g.45286 Transcript_17975/m.45286 type:complete len:240 (-) Transcript_17975:4-723(-)